MALPDNIKDREYNKFTLLGTDTAVRVFGVTTSSTTNPLSVSRSTLERDKFIEDDSGDTAIYFTATT